LPVGLFQRSKFGAIPQYHTSADNLDFIGPDHLSRSYRLVAETLDVIENDAVYWNVLPKCEPQLGKRGLYGTVGGYKDAAKSNLAMLWILNLSDGSHSLLDIAERAELPFAIVRSTAELLQRYGLLTSQRAHANGP
jgi:aminopeptidase-like protein